MNLLTPARLRRAGLGLAAPALAIAFAVVITWLVLLASGTPAVSTVKTLFDYAGQPDTIVLIINSAVTYYFAALAVAVGFRMNLFNIGVDGQYRLAAIFAAYVAGNVSLPAIVHVPLTLLVAVVVGGLWAGVAAVLKVYRGVSEVISTIMLNFVATGIIAYLLVPGQFAERTEGSNNVGTRTIPESGQVGGLGLVSGTDGKVYGLLLLAVVVGFLYWFVIGRTRFGFDLRATGLNEAAAVASGVDVKRMIIVSMLISGAVAGLIGMPQLLGSSHSYALDFPTGLGFTGIAVALLGRNHPIGIAIGALLWGFLDNSSAILELSGVAREIVLITQGVTVLSVVVAYELVRRYRLVAEQREVGRSLGRDAAQPVPSAPEVSP